MRQDGPPAAGRRLKPPTVPLLTASPTRNPTSPNRNNENLARLSTKIVSPVIFAHVRAAYPGMPVSEQNCHPFQFGRYLWMHNGVVGGFNCVRR
jgi:predicted glutamine amidotransferase